MSRFARIVLSDVPVHVVHRGNRRSPVFLEDADRSSYLEHLMVACNKYQVDLWAYCLMTNHVHLLVVPRRRLALARTIRAAHQGHALRLNRRMEQTGHLWENRYYSTVLDERHLWAAVRYIERNPVRAGMVECAELYSWSSARAHCGGGPDPYLSGARPFPGPVENWSEWLGREHEGDVEGMASLRQNSRTGWPSGSPDFIDRLATQLGRTLPPGAEADQRDR
jgi:putative transposase